MSSEDSDVKRSTAAVTRGGHLAVRRFVLRVISGPDAGMKHLSSGRPVVIGTHESADLSLSDPTVSRFHLALIIYVRF